jgi:ABC-type arginine transport system permease subunit
VTIGAAVLSLLLAIAIGLLTCIGKLLELGPLMDRI